MGRDAEKREGTGVMGLAGQQGDTGQKQEWVLMPREKREEEGRTGERSEAHI